MWYIGLVLHVLQALHILHILHILQIMTFSIRLPEESMQSILNKLSYDTGRTRAFYVLELLKENLKDGSLENKYNKHEEES